MKRTNIKLNLTWVSALVISLAGCGGGDDGDDDSSKNYYTDVPEVTNYVLGEFEYTSQTGKAFLSPDTFDTYGSCVVTDRYFESENTMVFASGKESDDDLMRVATLVEEALPDVLADMGLTLKEFYSIKRHLGYRSLDDLSRRVTRIRKQVPDTNPNDTRVEKSVFMLPSELSPYFDGKRPDGTDHWLDQPHDDESISQEMRVFVYNTLLEENDPQKVRDVLVEMAIEGTGLTTVELDDWYPQLHQKIQVCAKSNQTSFTSEELSQIPTSYAIRISKEASRRAYQHMLAVVVQKQFAETPPQWASAGQAFVVSGGAPANNGIATDIAEIFTMEDENLVSNTYFSGNKDFYPYYARAYKRLRVHNDLTKIRRWFLESGKKELIYDPAIDRSRSRRQYEEQSDVSKNSFGRIMTRELGEPLPYSMFKDRL